MVIAVLSITLLIVCSVAVLLPAVGAVGPNSFFGLRTPQTMHSEVAWRESHVTGVKVFAPFFAVSLVLAVVGLIADLNGVSWSAFAVCFAGILIAAYFANRRASNVK